MNGPKFHPTIRRPTAAKSNTNNHADWTDRSPAAIGKYGLLTLQQSEKNGLKMMQKKRILKEVQP